MGCVSAFIGIVSLAQHATFIEIRCINTTLLCRQNFNKTHFFRKNILYSRNSKTYERGSCSRAH